MQKLGEFELSRVVESEVPFIEPEVFLPDFTSDVLEANADWLYPHYIDPASGRLIFAFQSYILRTSRHVILVDTCVGNNKSRPARPMWHMQNGPYLADLATAGVRPEEVDFVLCTHLHVDHAGWNTQLIDGRWVPTFPNAKYIFARKEHHFWERRYRDGTEGSVPNIYEDSVLPVVEAGQAVLVEMDHQIDDGVWFEPAPGHTEGNVVINLRSGGAAGVLSGDVMHHPLQLVRPAWSSRACEDRVLSATTRQAFIERYADTDTLIAPAHFASPSMGRIYRKGEAFAYRLAEEA
jgi:glyoxylase-like metal-dependent hydrolase (beta-lactamase superfamily II)